MLTRCVHSVKQVDRHDCGLCRLTFDMSGSQKQAKPAFDCPLDGGVGHHCAHLASQTLPLSAPGGTLPSKGG